LFKTEKIAKIRAGFIKNPFGLWFATVVIGANVIESAVQTTMKTGIAEGTKFPPADEAF
jgi:hypothetical protein